ncbi:hypothetical protein SUGI_1498130 [Cryptomeria japonica]|uniref:Uncharacterized protein n=1 Tax=Cryptomeria japonica TaxID=3369 RepID=A0AAD3RRI3_CRYJA|nr:hypothetical protein SUGI_1223240 [Cryptomeria japonica]GLJ59231.1 hypothetical protein SUGI_1498130 [Cryptomeria japonica]
MKPSRLIPLPFESVTPLLHQDLSTINYCSFEPTDALTPGFTSGRPSLYSCIDAAGEGLLAFVCSPPSMAGASASVDSNISFERQSKKK